jgi:hypothetical protein
MKTNKLILIVILFINTNLFSQSFEDQVKAISENIESIKREEKNALKKGIETLDSQVNNKTISIEEYQAQKQTLAVKHAKNIEERVMVEEQKLRELISQKVDGKVVETMDEIQLKKDSLIVKYKKTAKENGEWYYNQKKNNTIIKQNYTETGFLFAMGINNLIDNNNFNSLNDENFALWESRFYEWGINRKSTLSKKSNWLSVRYGISFMYNNLRATNNRYFVKDGNQTNLVMHPNELKDSRLRNLNLVFPLHFEFDTSRNRVKTTENATYIDNSRGIRFGLGGYAGLNLNTRQFTEFYDENGKKEIEEKNNFNTNKFIYGLSAYIGYSWFSIYMKYDLNPLFKDNPIQQNNVSMGLRFDFDL